MCSVRRPESRGPLTAGSLGTVLEKNVVKRRKNLEREFQTAEKIHINQAI